MPDVTPEKLTSLVQRKVNTAMRDVETWIDHPTFNSKGALVVGLERAYGAAMLANEALTDRLIMTEYEFGIDWPYLHDVIRAIESQRGSDRSVVRAEVAAFRRSCRHLQSGFDRRPTIPGSTQKY